MNTNTKKWYQSRTMWVSIATAVAGILMAVSDSLQETGVENGILVTIIGVVNGILRYLTYKGIE